MPAAGLGFWFLDPDAVLFCLFEAFANLPILAVKIQIAIAHRQHLATAGAGEQRARPVSSASNSLIAPAER